MKLCFLIYHSVILPSIPCICLLPLSFIISFYLYYSGYETDNGERGSEGGGIRRRKEASKESVSQARQTFVERRKLQKFFRLATFNPRQLAKFISTKCFRELFKRDRTLNFSCINDCEQPEFLYNFEYKSDNLVLAGLILIYFLNTNLDSPGRLEFLGGPITCPLASLLSTQLSNELTVGMGLYSAASHLLKLCIRIKTLHCQDLKFLT